MIKKPIILLFSCIFSLTVYAQIPNPSFEEWENFAGYWAPVGWKHNSTGCENQISQSFDAYDGVSSIKLNAYEYQACPIQLRSFGAISYQYPDFKPFYYISYWVKIEGFPNASALVAQINADVEFRDIHNNVIGCSSKRQAHEITPQSGWQRVSWALDDIKYLQGNIPQDTLKSCGISLTLLVAAEYWDGEDYFQPGTIWIDNIQVSSTPFQTPFIKPIAGDHFLAGKEDTIKWDVGMAGQKAKLFYSTDDGANYSLLADNIPADTGMYVWNVPDTLLTAKAKVKLTDQSSGDILAESDKFIIKPYIFTRLESNGEMTGYNIWTDRWGFENDSADVWPDWYYNQFNYSGIDPFTNQPYDHIQAPVFGAVSPSNFVSWEAFVKAFTTDACYFDVNNGIYSPMAIANWAADTTNEWYGSCFAIAGSNALAFSKKQSFLSNYTTFPQFATPLSVSSTEAVVDNITQIYAHCYGDPTVQNWDNANDTPLQAVNDLKTHFSKADVTPRSISFWHNIDPGGHTVLPYQLRQDSINEQIYYIDIYDNSEPNDLEASIVINLADNGGNGSWDYSNLPGWGGSSYLILECDASAYLSPPILKKGERSDFILAGDRIRIGGNRFGDIQIADKQGNSAGYYDDQLKHDIEGCVPLIPPTGSFRKPYAYSLIDGNYSVTLDNFTSEIVNAFFFYNNKALIYKRTGADEMQTDRLTFGNGLSVVNPDEESKDAQLDLIIKEMDREKVFRLYPLPLDSEDSVRLESPDDNQMILYNYGSAKKYGVELNSFSSSGFERFVHDSIPIGKNTSHRFNVNWTDVEKSELMVYVDNEMNDSYEDTLLLNHHITGIDDKTIDWLKSEINFQVWPNPARENITVSYQLSSVSEVSMKIFDSFGKEALVPLKPVKQMQGKHVMPIDLTDLTPGIYYYRLIINNQQLMEKIIKF